MTLGLNNLARPDLGSVRRPMSIASAPEELDVLEFYIRYVSHPESENPLTHLLWKTRAPERVYLRDKAVGKFTLADTVGEADPRVKVFVAAGTGLAPFVSIVRSHVLRDPAADLSRYAVLHGASYPADLGYVGELESYRAKGLHYMTTVSRPKESPDWRGDVGRVEDYFLPDRLEELEDRLGLGAGGFAPDRAAVFICGLQGTIGLTITRLVPRGFVPEARKLRRALEAPEDVAATVFFEQYDATPIIDVNDPEVIGPLRAQLHEALATA
jgi:ferredoxin--NADP+ reductase